MRCYSLKAIRIDLGLTMEEASKLIGISKYTLFNYEHFNTVPKISIIQKIEKAYDIDVGEIRFLPNEKEKKLAVKNDK